MRTSIARCRAGLAVMAALCLGTTSRTADVSAQEYPSFHDAAAPQGWSVATRGIVTTLTADAPIPLPVEMILQVRLPERSIVALSARESADSKATLLRTEMRPARTDAIQIAAFSDDQPMETDTISTRTWTQVDKPSGRVIYSRRFPMVRNLWEERDRAEIGAAYERLVPLGEKTFALRWVLAPEGRQVWVDDRLVAEARTPLPPRIHLSLQLTREAQATSLDFAVPTPTPGFLPLSLLHYSHLREAQGLIGERTPDHIPVEGGRPVPILALKQPKVDLDLGESLHRYRLTHGSGPNAGYVNARCSWPGPFAIDPAKLTFRVPYRAYQNAWLVAWVDDKADAVPRGAFRFYREDAGYCATTEFEITEAAMAEGKVRRLDAAAPSGKPLYLVRVPVDTDALYGFRDMAGQFLDFELTKPLALGRSYPDPIYYGRHPAGPESSIRVVGITLEESPFWYEVRPAKTAHVFERPERPEYVIAVANTSAADLEVAVTLSTKSYNEDETRAVRKGVRVAANATAEIPFVLDVERNGWHELRARVEAAGVVRGNTLSFVLLPPDRRTYGASPNERRFGLWSLWGHYLPLRKDRFEENEKYLAMFRRIGMRSVGVHSSFLKPEDALRRDFLPKSPHTLVEVFHRLDENDPQAMEKMIVKELAQVEEDARHFPETGYFYGGEWHLGREIQYAPWPAYTGEGDRDLTEDERQRVARHTKIFTAIGRAIREKYPKTKLYLQWGAPQGTIAFMKYGFPKDLVDGFGMDAPMFELLPEISNVTGCLNNLWWLRAQAGDLGWPRLPINWCEGPFFPTNEGAMTEREQEQRQIRYWLLGMAYGIDQFEAGVVDFDAGNYYGAEHYGAGVFHRSPLEHPKPAVAAIATATTMLCGADPVGGVDTGSLTTYCMAFRKAAAGEMLYALWRVHGTAEAVLKTTGPQVLATDSMGNTTPVAVADGAARVIVTPSPVWITGGGRIESVRVEAPIYDDAPASLRRPLAEMTAAAWVYDGSEDKDYANNHFAIKRVADPQLRAEFGAGEPGYEDAVAVTLPQGPGDRPLANRYGALKALHPIVIPGKAAALGLWVKGNSSWGRIVYQLRDAKGELWTANGTKDDWNCDDTHGWSYVNFDGWRYVRFPLPSSHPWDQARGLETTWWGARGGDGIVDLPLSVVKIYVEARNEVPWLGEMRMIRERSYKLSRLVAEYASKEDTDPGIYRRYAAVKPIPSWSGPTANPIADLLASGAGDAPEIKGFEEPHHWNDGRRMIIRFDQKEGFAYKLYLSRYPDGRGAELLPVRGEVADRKLITGLRPDTEMYLFLTAVGADKKESKPSPAFRLVTQDNFAEK